MRRWPALLLFSVIVAAQSKPQFRGSPPASERPQPARRGGYGYGVPWWAWPGWWSSSLSQRPLPPPVDPPKETPAVVWNPHYEPARPVAPVRSYETVDAGSIPAQKGAPPAGPCQLREASGGEFDGLECSVTGDAVRWRSPDGRWHRATTDLVDIVRNRP